MKMFAELTPDEWLDGMVKKILAVKALLHRVEGTTVGQPDPVTDAKAWVHTAFHPYRSALPDKNPRLYPLAKTEHDFVAALGVLSVGDQVRQLREALNDMLSFHHASRSERLLSEAQL